ncbi:hypothetical protein Pcinc_024181 [Petrolisthes cinctipes]|uniref:Uncharacterized protein n=1 Tax=Petrolisthes cinctipes TaxID=88211 RepID=A0AAE1FB32_PETCI|nr:hypothetical protein Pcinc_024181 [Petrolisthes cinctipes]
MERIGDEGGKDGGEGMGKGEMERRGDGEGRDGGEGMGNGDGGEGMRGGRDGEERGRGREGRGRESRAVHGREGASAEFMSGRILRLSWLQHVGRVTPKFITM